MVISNVNDHTELVGKTLNIFTPDKKYSMRFEDNESMSFSECGAVKYSCATLDEGLFLVEFGSETSIAIIDLKSGLATISLPDIGYKFGAFERQWQPLPIERHYFTDELVGTGMRWYFESDKFTNQVYFSTDRCRMSWAENNGIERYENVPARYTHIRDNVFFADLMAPLPDSIAGSDKYQRIVELMDLNKCCFVGFAYGDNTAPVMVSAAGETIEVDPSLLNI